MTPMAFTSPAQAHAEFTAAFNAGDLDALCDMYEPDAAFVPELDAEAVRGMDAIRQGLAAFLALKGTIKIDTVFAHQCGDIALSRSRWTLSATGPDGSPMLLSGSSTEVLRRGSDGAWRHIIDHPFGAS
ncbi:MAG: DUF4440 domain-containing protein [Bryobacteraceae bacterium]|nr:DUF4440 domain-containing protein [Bryobacteraceae bacterium]